MSFSVVGSVNHLVAEHRRFLLSTYRLAGKKLRDQFEEHIKQTDVLVKGPYVTLANDFAREHTLKQLHDLDVGYKDLQRLQWSFGERELFLHQEQSLPFPVCACLQIGGARLRAGRSRGRGIDHDKGGDEGGDEGEPVRTRRRGGSWL